mmetsp:Transcript_41304/g.124993  ORF Transcript_41304/g.124993 Transcript_41304/m.124993 type:complete len:126 (-) Transcript_41304:32-409(-)
MTFHVPSVVGRTSRSRGSRDSAASVSARSNVGRAVGVKHEGGDESGTKEGAGGGGRRQSTDAVQDRAVAGRSRGENSAAVVMQGASLRPGQNEVVRKQYISFPPRCMLRHASLLSASVKEVKVYL